MKYLVKLALLSVVAAIFSASAMAAPVFKISKDGNDVYIGGTFHILTAKDFPLPQPFYDVYEKVDELYFETDIEGTTSDPKFQAMMMNVMMLKGGETLQSILSEPVYNDLVTYLKSKGIPPQQFANLSPTGVMLTITIMEYQARGFTLAGVDQHMFEKAKADNKAVKWFESLEEQVAFLDSLDQGDPNEPIVYMLESIDGLETIVDDLRNGWRNGDMALLEKSGLTEFEEFPDSYNTLIKDRNDKWMASILPMFSDENTEFVLVGALHLPGKDGLLTQLEAKGFTVEQLK